ncbi:MarR family winged helix-turn-helix transcriptional regulator [Nitriliruptor alkaliphilus]|uniref:MarR family winged helix-turn-helix transcriptional regulator n=1 Tax=Nitriliruptor alkaliphilus TaxID=427918 RepID=UPI000695B397|nr:MarR family transcriptional regulator [Nitriliruptor alkaliphilus]
MSDHVAGVVEQWRERRPDLDLTGMAVFARISRIERIAELRRAEVLDRLGLQSSDVSVLAALWRHPGGLRPLELRRTMLVGSGTLTARLDRLEAAGLLERLPDASDRRGRVLHLTARGSELVPAVVTELLDIENELLAALPPGVRERLCKDLGRLSRDLEQGAGEG